MSRINPAAALISPCLFCLCGFAMALDTTDSLALAVSGSGGEVVIPAAISLAGAYETQWESDFRFFNPCGENLDVRIEFQPENTNNAGATLVSREFQLLPNETVVFNGIFDTIPDLEDGEVSGSLLIRSTSASGCSVLMVSRTFNDTPDGTLGLAELPLTVVAPEETFLDFPGLIHNQAYRTNLRVVNFSATTVWVPVMAYDQNGDQVGDNRSAKVFGRSTKQINDVASWLSAPDDLAPFTVRADVNGREVQAVATVVDNTTGDSVLYLSSFADTNRLWLVGAASLTGVNESQWFLPVTARSSTNDWLAG